MTVDVAAGVAVQYSPRPTTQLLATDAAQPSAGRPHADDVACLTRDNSPEPSINKKLIHFCNTILLKV